MNKNIVVGANSQQHITVDASTGIIASIWVQIQMKCSFDRNDSRSEIEQ